MGAPAAKKAKIEEESAPAKDKVTEMADKEVQDLAKVSGANLLHWHYTHDSYTAHK